ncbi:MAG: ATPase involved in replication control Cdc46/Mcm family [Candidatus Methanohalarchaeum thermophilum]|uniref:DNA helicase n=1 Tax=Methanohalarchaeum thermophilum TaxID=1903181 RepID=A0A1Q6DW49_METT1|nr:MAG: ATPase involved in replication control Cdc46/Mcm family [Candidatus Methanohalarchaeum thermophilum]
METSLEDITYIDKIKEFLNKYYRKEVLNLAKSYPENKSLRIEYSDLEKFDSDLKDKLLKDPEEVIEAAKKSIRTIDLPIDKKFDQINFRVINLPKEKRILASNIRSKHIGKLISTEGIVRKATEVRPKLTKATFKCLRCGEEIEVVQNDRDLTEPNKCTSCERKGPFNLLEEKSVFIDSQKLQIQEPPEDLRGGEQPQELNIHISDDITGIAVPGNRIVLNGVLKSFQKTKNKKKTTLFDVFLEANSIEIKEQEFKELEISDTEKEKILEFSKDKNVYDKIRDSIAPSIYGYEKVKEAMALQLFSGIPKKLPNGSRIRGDIHTLLVGDPGIGKCVSPETKITLGSGQQIQILDLVESYLDNDAKEIEDGYQQPVENGLKVKSLNLEKKKITEREINRVWKRRAPKEMVEIKTTSGKSIKVTPSHPLLIEETGIRWKKARHIDEGMLVKGIKPISSKHKDRNREIHQDPAASSREVLEVNQICDYEVSEINYFEPSFDWVYDLEINNHHNYITDDIFSHNSQILRYVSNLAPRGVYASGKNSTSAGLTAAAVRDEFGDGKWTLEAGALVLADKGIATIDEIDKMDKKDRSALHESMEQQTISIAKAGITATLQSRCALLGAANPKYGRFDEFEPVAEQINLEPTLLSRFDLIFTLTDKPDENRDKKIADHIITTHHKGEKTMKPINKEKSNNEEKDTEEEIDPEIKPELLRKFVAFSKRIVPILTDEAKEKIKKYYLNLREIGEEEDSPVPVTARQLEALIRLAEASARTRLSDKITPTDAERSIKIVRQCLEEVGMDPETGELDIDVLATGTTKSQRDKIKIIRGVIDQLEKGKSKGAPIEEVLEKASEHGLEKTEVKESLRKLREKGDIIEPKAGKTVRTT